MSEHDQGSGPEDRADSTSTNPGSTDPPHRDVGPTASTDPTSDFAWTITSSGSEDTTAIERGETTALPASGQAPPEQQWERPYDDQRYAAPQQQAYGQPPAYGQQGYPPPPSPYAGYRAPGPTNSNAIALTATSGVVFLFCGGVFVLPAAVFGIFALTKQHTEPEESAKLTRWGWIAFGIGVAVTVLAVVGLVVALVAASATAYGDV